MYYGKMKMQIVLQVLITYRPFYSNTQISISIFPAVGTNFCVQVIN